MIYLQREKVIGNFNKDENVVYTKDCKKGFAKIIDLIVNKKYEKRIFEKYLLEDNKTKDQFTVDIDAHYFFIGEIRFDKIYLEAKHLNNNYIKNKIDLNKSFINGSKFKIQFKNIENTYISEGEIGNSFYFYENENQPLKLIYLQQLFEVLDKYEIYYSKNEILYV